MRDDDVKKLVELAEKHALFTLYTSFALQEMAQLLGLGGRVEFLEDMKKSREEVVNTFHAFVDSFCEDDNNDKA